ncbi:MAG: hypothetical protein ACRDRZ_15015 [Pseudonocardiaceae bacterium]
MRGRTAAVPLAAMVLAAMVLAGCVLAGCAQAVPEGAPGGDRRLVAAYFAAGNDAGRQGSAAMQQFLDETQHPDFRGERCPLYGLTLEIDPAMTTLRPDPDWRPPGAQRPPRGAVYIIAVTVTVLADQVELDTQIGSQHIVVLDGTAYGFAPCPA